MSGPHNSLAPATAEPRKLVGVTTPLAAGERTRLLEALEWVVPVTFEIRTPTELDGLDGLVVLCDDQATQASLRSTASLAGCPTLMLLGTPAGVGSEAHTVQLSQDSQLARPLRGRRLHEESAVSACTQRPSNGDSVLARLAGIPVWWSSQGEHGQTHVSTFTPQELGERESLRERLRFGRFMGLLPLLHFLWGLCDELSVERGLRAAFVIDDPNLHRASYGYLDYPRLLAEATRHGYHVAFATVPLDGWRASAQAARLLRESSSVMSLLMHGNDHTNDELGRLTDERRSQVVLAQALRRVQTFERRSGVRVERVMVPPHEVCATMALTTMFRLGFEAACIGRGHPWVKSQSTSPLSWALVKWFPTDVVGGGFPIVPRYPLDRPWEDLVFRALLGQPLILFAHHWDFADGLDVLARATEYIDGLGDVRWSSIGSIAQNSYTVSRHGEGLVVNLYSRRAVVEVPAGVGHIEVRAPRVSADERGRELTCDGARRAMVSEGFGRDGWTSGRLPILSGKPVELRVSSDRALDPAGISASAHNPWPMVRRALVEGRDRIEPYARGLRLR